MTYQDVFFAQEHEAEPWLSLFTEHGPWSFLTELDAAGALDVDGETRATNPAGPGDHTATVVYQGRSFSIAWNYGLPYIGVCEIVDPDE